MTSHVTCMDSLASNLHKWKSRFALSSYLICILCTVGNMFRQTAANFYHFKSAQIFWYLILCTVGNMLRQTAAKLYHFKSAQIFWYLILCTIGNMLRQTAANFYHFLWWRVVCDEAHEIIVYNRTGPSDGLRTVTALQSRHRWYVTGTPFPHGLESLRAALKVRLPSSKWYCLLLESNPEFLVHQIQAWLGGLAHRWQRYLSPCDCRLFCSPAGRLPRNRD